MVSCFAWVFFSFVLGKCLTFLPLFSDISTDAQSHFAKYETQLNVFRLGNFWEEKNGGRMRMKELFWWLNQSNPSKGCSTPEREVRAFGRAWPPTPRQPNTTTLGEKGRRSVDLNWFSEPVWRRHKIVGSLLPVVLMESDMSVLTCISLRNRCCSKA